MSRDAQRSGGARGGRAEFSWDKVAAGDARLNYIGASVKTQVGRFQKDAQWYIREKADGGGAGGGGATATNGGAGGSGAVIISVPTASYSANYTGTVSVTTSGSNTIMTFTASGSYTA